MKRFVETVAGWSDEQVGGETLIPPWTRGHVVTHVARAADSLRRLLEGARTGVEIPQYATMAARAAEIEAGARRAVAELVDDVMSSGERFDAEVRALPEAAWQRRVRLRTGELRTPASVVATRLRELEVHHADLAAGYTFADVPEAAARWIVEDIVGALARRGPQEGARALRIEATDAELAHDLLPAAAGKGPVVVSGRLADLLGWISGRSGREGTEPAGLSVRGADRVPPAPPWI